VGNLPALLFCLLAIMMMWPSHRRTLAYIGTHQHTSVHTGTHRRTSASRISLASRVVCHQAAAASRLSTKSQRLGVAIRGNEMKKKEHLFPGGVARTRRQWLLILWGISAPLCWLAKSFPALPLWSARSER